MIIEGYTDKHEYISPRGVKSTVYLMDCMEGLKQIPKGLEILAVVDCPYGININVNMGRRKGDSKSTYHKFIGEDKEIPSKEYFEYLFSISENQIIWGGNYMTQYLYPSPCWLLWDKGFSENVTFAQVEMAWTSFNSSAKKIDFNAAANNERIHPTQKPVYLYKWIYHRYSKPTDIILDTHLGSQSSRIAADMANLEFIGFELDSDYFRDGCKRFDNYTKQLKLEL